MDRQGTVFRYVYGPVPSRRLGLSLGISVVPAKTCTLDCVYCQCGRTTRKTVVRESFFPVEDILAEVRAVARRAQIDYLTFSGEGEPTLNRDLGQMVRRLKKEFSIPVAVITNGTLFTDPAVRRSLYAADLVVPSLDAAEQRTFARIDRGHRNLKIEEIIAGLVTFRRYYKGQMWLEIMLVKNVNDAVEHLIKLRQAVHRIKPHKVHLNTVVRPPAEKGARPLSEDDLAQIRMLFGPDAEVVAAAPVSRKKGSERNEGGDKESQRVLAMVRGRPSTPADISCALGVTARKVSAILGSLLRRGLVRQVRFCGKIFFEAT